MFRPGETVCVSHNQYSYHSIPLGNALDGLATLVPTSDSATKRKLTLEQSIEKIDTGQLIFCSLNPIKGYREDINCTAYRNFLIEVDYGPLKEQLAYIKNIGLPYSAVVFSGNKSLHFLVSLDQDLPSEDVYRLFSEWTLNVVSLADSKTKNPSRMIRIPGAYREPKKKQILVELKGKTKLDSLVTWLNKYPNSKPAGREKRTPSENPNFNNIKPWCVDLLVNGLKPDKGRNQQWYSIAMEFCLSGYSEDDTVGVLSQFFISDRDFKEREWKTCIRSAFKTKR